jgi:hypothetical protein
MKSLKTNFLHSRNSLRQSICPLSALLALALLAFSSLSSRAELIINIYESGSDVIADVSGSVIYAGPGTGSSFAPDVTAIVPQGNILSFNPLGGAGSFIQRSTSLYPNPTFGNGGTSIATSVSGNTDFFLYPGFFLLPADYVLGTPISVTATFADTTISAMGMNPGIYYYKWDDGPNLDGATLNIGGGPAPVPEPGTWAAAALLVGGAAFARWRKRAKVS